MLMAPMAKKISFGSCLSTVALLSAFGALSCSAKVVDLGSNPRGDSTDPIYSSDPPPDTSASAIVAGTTAFRIVDKEYTNANYQYGDCEGMLCDHEIYGNSFTVVSGRLYWVSRTYPGSNTRNFVRSCNIDHCASSLFTHYTTEFYGGCYQGDQDIQADFRSDASMIYWRNNCAGEILYSPMDGHSAATSISATGAIYTNFVVDGGLFYATTDAAKILRCTASDCAPSLELFAMTPPAAEADSPLSSNSPIVAQDSDYLYLVDAANARLIRVRKDPKASFEVLVHLPKYIAIAQVVLQGDSLYWVENVLMGELKSCAKTGCADKPTTLMTGLHRPTSLAVDDSSLYVLEPPEITGADYSGVAPNTGRILKCPTSGCTNPTVVYSRTDEMFMESLLVDDRFLYFSGNYCKRDNYISWQGPCAYIAAVPK